MKRLLKGLSFATLAVPLCFASAAPHRGPFSEVDDEAKSVGVPERREMERPDDTLWRVFIMLVYAIGYAIRSKRFDAAVSRAEGMGMILRGTRYGGHEDYGQDPVPDQKGDTSASVEAAKENVIY